jgi:hypothetical protein
MCVDRAHESFILCDVRGNEDRTAARVETKKLKDEQEANKATSGAPTLPVMTFGSLGTAKAKAPKKAAARRLDPFRSDEVRIESFLRGLKKVENVIDLLSIPSSSHDVVADAPLPPRVAYISDAVSAAEYFCTARHASLPPIHLPINIPLTSEMTPEQRVARQQELNAARDVYDDLIRKRDEEINVEWEKVKKDQELSAPWDELAAANERRRDLLVEARQLYNSSIIRGDLPGVTFDSLKRFNDAVGWHGAIKTTRGSGRFSVLETTTLLSIPANCFCPGEGMLHGDRALIKVSTGLRIYEISESYASCGCCGDEPDQTFLNTASISVLLPTSFAFSNVLDVAWRSSEIPEEVWSFESTSVGLTVAEGAANMLEKFACGEVKPETSQSGLLIRSLLQCGGNGCNSSGSFVLEQMCLDQDSQTIFVEMGMAEDILLENAETEEEAETIEQNLERFKNGAGEFVATFPALRKSATTTAAVTSWNSSASIVSSFESDVQKQIKLTAMSTHATRVLENRVSPHVASKTRSKALHKTSDQSFKMARTTESRNLIGLNALVEGWQRNVDELCKSDEPKVPMRRSEFDNFYDY